MSMQSRILAAIAALGVGGGITAGVSIVVQALGNGAGVVVCYGSEGEGEGEVGSPTDSCSLRVDAPAAQCAHLLKRGGDNVNDYPAADAEDADDGVLGRALMALVGAGTLQGWHTTADTVAGDCPAPFGQPGTVPCRLVDPDGSCFVTVWLSREQASAWRGLLTAGEGPPVDVLEAANDSYESEHARFAGQPSHVVDSFVLEAQ
jgi:hypothetical protein